MHARDFPHGRVFEVDVQTLGLIDEGTPIGGHLDDLPLRDLPHGFVQRFDVGGDVGDVLDGAAVGDDAVFHVVGPEAHVYEVFEQPGVDDLEFAREHAPRVDVRGVGFETFVVAQDLRCAGCGHGGDEETVADAVAGDVAFEAAPVPEGAGGYVPHVVLEDSLGYGRAFVGGVWTEFLG